MRPSHRLRYEAPAPDWLSALPLGNGRLGAMCWGGPEGERIGVNHEHAWSGPVGGPATATPGDAPQRVRAAREAVLEGNHHTAEKLLGSVVTPHTQSYLPVGDLHLRWLPRRADGEPASYARGLDLHSATSWVERRWPGAAVRQETRVSHPADVLVHHAVSEGGPADFAVRLTTPLRSYGVEVTSEDGDGLLVARAELPVDVAPWSPHQDTDPVTWAPDGSPAAREVLICVRVRGDGAIEAGADGLSVRSATHVELVLSCEVTAPPSDAEDGAPSREERAGKAARTAAGRAREALARGAAALAEEHEEDVARLWGDFRLDLRGEPAGGSTDTLVADRHRPEAVERGMVELLVAYARHLMISGSRRGTQPLTLQGLWNDRMQPPWSSNHTLNINQQMAYWPAEAWGLAECHEPLLAFVRRLASTGERTARAVYGLPGWTAHHNSDLWAQSAPFGGGWTDPSWSSWPMAGAWLCLHLWEHVRHAADQATAAADVLPVLTGAVRFCLAWLVELPDGSLGTVPSTSPENQWRGADGQPVSVAVSSTCDLALAAGLLRAYLGASALAGAPTGELRHRAEAALARIPPPGVGSRGELLEWREELPDTDPRHRHTSHLVGLYPLDLLDVDATPESARAAARSLELRGDESTGWALAWRMCLWARLRRPDRVGALLARCLRSAEGGEGRAHAGGLYPNLFSAHPPFQLDGNLGFAAGVLEALVQSSDRAVRLLPALPASWPEGRLTGMHTRAGVVVDLAWSEGRPSELVLRAKRPAELSVHCEGWVRPLGPFRLAAGEVARIALPPESHPA